MAGDEPERPITVKEATEIGLITQECCNGCGKERGKLLRINAGMYSGSIYCTECMARQLKNERYLKYKRTTI